MVAMAMSMASMKLGRCIVIANVENLNLKLGALQLGLRVRALVVDHDSQRSGPGDGGKYNQPACNCLIPYMAISTSDGSVQVNGAMLFEPWSLGPDLS